MAPLFFLHGFTGAPKNALSLAWPSSLLFAPALLGHRGNELDPTSSRDSERIIEAEPLASVQLPANPDGDWALERGSFVAEVDRLAAWIRARHWSTTDNPGHLVGYSLGARLGLGMLTRHRRLFTTATLISVHPGLSSRKERQQRLNSDLQHCRLLATKGVDAFVAQWERQPLFATQNALPREAWLEQAQTRRQHTAAGLIQSLLDCGLAAMPDYGASLAAIDCPITLITGELDAKFNGLAETMVRSLARGRHIAVEGTAHNPLVERPDRVREIVRDQVHSSAS